MNHKEMERLEMKLKAKGYTKEKYDESKDHINKGWVFRTKEECEAFCSKLNDAINQVKS